LLESTVDRRARLDTLVKVDSGKGALADTLGGDLEFLQTISIHEILKGRDLLTS
jgi:hypothetical protein